MAPAADAILKKSAFRCLDVARYVVAAAVSMLMVTVLVCAVKVVHRPHDLTLWIIGGSVSAERAGDLNGPFNANIRGDNLTFTFTLQAVNPSGRVRIYYTNPIARLRGRNSSSVMKTMLALRLPDVSVEHQSTVDINVLMNTFVLVPGQRFYFEALANGSGSSIADAFMKVNGTRIVQNIFTGQNLTSEQAFYYCSPIVFDEGEYYSSAAAVNVPCTEEAPTTILDDPLPGIIN
uniref:Late embryogenesis abundant protein LEA-2 subgroup domain-containing protein n=1 Tax=Aegilops tauschii subsp. strangulata TaxID=200361 RepID=A0A452XQU3_AEGTS